jgi:carboxyl-terminal processing protease
VRASEVKVKQRWAFVLVSTVVIAGIVLVASGAVSGSGKGVYGPVGVFGKIVSLVRSQYVEEVPVERLEQGALTGLVEAADPGGAFVPDGAREPFSRHLGRTLPAFGMVIGKRFSYPLVLQVLPGSPAAQAGIQPGELIESVDGKPVRARPTWLAWSVIEDSERAGRSVTLDVIDRQLGGKRPIKLQVGKLVAPEPSVEMRSNVVVARLPVIDSGSAKSLGEQLRTRAGAPAIVLDLRGSSLGTVRGAVDAAVVLAGGECEIRLGGQGKSGEVLREKGEARGWKVFVCIDLTTAGPAELLAAALKSRGATLVGSETYGDTAQRRSQRGGGGELWMAETWGLGPDGKPLLGDGLKADERVRGRRNADPVLDRALELAGSGAAKQAA